VASWWQIGRGALLFLSVAGAFSACGVAFEEKSTADAATTTGTGGTGGTGATGGIAGTGGSGGSGGAGGQPPSGLLVDDALLVRYWIDEAASGTALQVLQDAAPDPLNLTIAFAGVGSFATHDNNRALHFPQPNGAAYASVSIDGTKLAALTGSRRATIEAVVHLEQATNLGDRIVHVGALTSFFSLEATSTTSAKLDYNDADAQGIGLWQVADLNAAGRVVMHAVLNTEAATPSDRVRLYINGVAQPGGTLNPPTLNDAISLPGGQYLVLGNRLPAERSMGGFLHYAALYLEALTQAQIDHNASALLASDDRPDAP
jgi:hypothetical protein